jgi:integrase/recombinase XerD
MNASVNIALDTRHQITLGEDSGKFHVKVTVTFRLRDGDKNKWLRKRFKTGVYLLPGEFNKVMSKNVQGLLREKKDALLRAQHKAMDILERMPDITPEQFENIYSGSGRMENVVDVFDYYINNLEGQERDGTAASYSNAISSFMEFKRARIKEYNKKLADLATEHEAKLAAAKSDWARRPIVKEYNRKKKLLKDEFPVYLSFAEITVPFLKEYEKWVLKEGNTVNTVGIYTRALRAIFNYAVDPLKIITAERSPFGRRKYVPPSAPRRSQKAHTLEEKNMILAHRSRLDEVNEALDYWVFQYLCNGCNMADVAYLRFKNISGSKLEFERKKTENTERNKQPIVVYVMDRMHEIIARRGNKSLNPEDYVFPILSADMSSKQRKDAILEHIGKINERLLIAEREMGLQSHLTTGTARYTAATILDSLGMKNSLIAGALGHGSEIIQESYKDRFNDGLREMISKMLAG